MTEEEIQLRWREIEEEMEQQQFEEACYEAWYEEEKERYEERQQYTICPERNGYEEDDADIERSSTEDNDDYVLVCLFWDGVCCCHGIHCDYEFGR